MTHNLPKASLGYFPTPLIELTRLSKTLGGPNIYMKRDDNTGLALGGNKTRKLEYIMGDALANSGRDIVYSCSWPAYTGSDESTKPFDT